MTCALTLELRYTDRPQRPAVAWWLAGDSAAEWLREITSWPVSQAEMAIYAIPRVGAAAAGVLIVPRREDCAALRAASVLAIPLGSVADQLFVPDNAEFFPQATDAEVAALLPAPDAKYLWRPAGGLIRFDESSRLRIGDLVRPLDRRYRSWSRAVPGTVLNRRLLSIAPEIDLDIETMLQQARDDIGTQSRQLPRLPRSPREMTRWRAYFPLTALISLVVLGIVCLCWWLSNRVGEVGTNVDKVGTTVDKVGTNVGEVGTNVREVGTNNAWLVALLVLAAILLLWRGMPHLSGLGGAGGDARRPAPADSTRGARAAGRGWFSGVRSWLTQRVARFNERLEALRHREVERLLHMLDKEPEEGLRHALPIASELPRGVAEPGAQLVPHSIEFNPLRIGGGGPADYWDIGAEYRLRLVKKYRELANREIALGRHRRAAYIFAELLGDLRAAATTLADGGHYREAAVVFDQRLHDARAAARCLEQGGLLTEAIGFYHGFGEHEKVGELYDRLQQPDFAAEAYRRAVAAKLGQLDFLAAARLLESRLRQPAEAQDTLMKAWPRSAQAWQCLEESFQLLARQGVHDRATRQIRELAGEWDGSPESVRLAGRFAQLATQYPDADVRRLAADQTRVLVSHRLDDQQVGEVALLVEAVRQLVPQDRLLTRDCNRFLQNRQRAKPPARVSPRQIAVVGEFQLPEADWRTAIAYQTFFAVGFRGDALVMVRGNWDGQWQMPTSHPWHIPDLDTDAETIHLCAVDSEHRCLIAHVFGHLAPTHSQRLPAFDRYPPVTVGGLPALRDSTIAFGVSPDSELTTIRQDADALVLETSGLVDGTFTRSVLLNVEVQRIPAFPAQILHRVGGVELVHIEDAIIAVHSDGNCTTAIQPNRIVELFSLHDGRFDQVVASLATGAVIWFGNPLTEPGQRFGVDLCEPKVCFPGFGHVAIADHARIEVYDTQDHQMRLVASSSSSIDGPPIALVACHGQQRFAVFRRSGQVTIYELPLR